MLKNTINSINDFITGEKFYSCADMIYSPDIKPEFDDYNIQVNTFDKEKLKDLNTIYTHTLYVKYLFDEIKDLPNKFIIITHNSDINIDYSFHIPNNVIKWYAQNANIIGNYDMNNGNLIINNSLNSKYRFMNGWNKTITVNGKG
jgi:hypothetical protein